MTPAGIEARLKEAAQTLSYLRAERPAGYRSVMPDPVELKGRGEDAAYGQAIERLKELLGAGIDCAGVGLYRSSDPPRTHATIEQLKRLDEVLEWRWLFKRHRREWVAMWGHAEGWKRGRIARRLNCSRWQAWNLARLGYARAARKLNGAV